MLLILSRSLHKSVHLVHTKPIPLPPQYFAPRGLPIQPRSTPLVAPASIALQLAPPTSLVPLEAHPNTRFPVKKSPEDMGKTVKATRKFLKTSIKKIWGMCRALRGLHAEDAISTLENIRKKPAFWLMNIVKTGIRNAVNIKGMQEDRLYVKEIIMGKNKGIQGIRRHAKGRFGEMLRPKTQVTIVIQEKTVEELYKTIMKGKFSPAIANMLRNTLLTQNSSFEEIRKIQNYLTAKGRQQQKLMFKRKVEKFLTEKKEQGLVLDKEYVEELILEEDSKAFVQAYWDFKKAEVEKRIAERQEVFNKNIKNR